MTGKNRMAIYSTAVRRDEDDSFALLISMLNFAVMRRGKLSLKLISGHKCLTTTFHKRKKSLIMKAHELSTICDVRTCILIHGPAPVSPHHDDPSAVEFHSWPPNRNEIEGMISAYKTNCFRKIKCFDLQDFFSDRKGKIEKETSKLRKDMDQIKYPKWDERFDCLSEDQLRLLMDGLCFKIEIADGMIDFLEGDYDHLIGERPQISAIHSQFHLLQTEESPQFQMQMMPTEDLDFSDFLLGPDGDQYTNGHLQSLFMEDKNMATFDSILPSQFVPPSFDYSDFEYVMASNF